MIGINSESDGWRWFIMSSFYGSDLERSLPSGWTNERRLEYYKWAAKVQIVLDDVLKRKPLRNMGGSLIWTGDFGYIL